MLSVEQLILAHTFEMPEGALCLTPTGWRPERYEVTVQLQAPTTLEQALQAIWNQHGNLLGIGDLVFKTTGTVPYPRGFLVFIPTDA